MRARTLRPSTDVHPGRRSQPLAALLALVCFASATGAWRLMVDTYTGQLMEQSALTGSLIGARFVSEHARSLLHVVSMPALVVLVLLVLVLGLRAGSRRRASWAISTVIATTASIQVLKRWVLERPDYGLSWRWDGANTLPSGHTGVAAAAAVALVLVVGSRWRAAAAWSGALLTVAMGYSTLVCQWHRPADVLAAVLIAVGWGALAVACGAWSEEPGADAAGESRTVPRQGALTSVGVLGGLGALAGAVAAFLEVWTWTGVAEGSSRTDDFIAYAAGSAGTVAVAFVGMALLAALCPDRCARPPGACGSDDRCAHQQRDREGQGQGPHGRGRGHGLGQPDDDQGGHQTGDALSQGL